MNFQHDQELIEKYPLNYTAIVIIKELISLDAVQRAGNRLKNSNIIDSDLDNKVLPIIYLWADIFQKMGAKPKYKSSLASLYEHYNISKQLYKISPIVDLYNYYSLYNGLPMAAYDLHKLSGDLKLSIVPKGLNFTPLGNSKIIEKTKNNEVAYVDENKVVCRYWNLKDCDQSKISDKTSDFLFVFDILSNENSSHLNIFNQIKDDFKDIFGNSFTFAGLTGRGVGNILTFQI